MTNDATDGGGSVWRYLAGGTVKHALLVKGSLRVNYSMCGRYRRGIRGVDLWLGTGSPRERETLAMLRHCSDCTAIVSRRRF